VKYKKLLLGLIVVMIFLGLWYFVIVPEFEKIPDDFTFKANLISIDNFYDEDKQEFSGEVLTKSYFSYDALSSIGDILILNNFFDVKTISGEKIFSVSRKYAIDRKTGMHVAGYGDKDRSGYLFFPKNAKKEDYVYWHVNYDAPATMKFQDEEIINGLKVYRFESNYKSDATSLLTHLPGVPEKRGVTNDINLQLWIEPVLGMLIKYEDKTSAYFYDIDTGEYLSPWNNFNNEFSEDSITTQVIKAQNEKFKLLLIKTLIPLLIVILISALTLFLSLREGKIIK
jgi:hypothetical protein